MDAPLIFPLSLAAALSSSPYFAPQPFRMTTALATPGLRQAALPPAVPPAAPPAPLPAVSPVVLPALPPEPGPRLKHSPAFRLSVVSVGLLGAQIGTLSVLGYLPPDATGWGEGSFDQIVENDLRGPKWDTDHWAWNYVAHPIAGSEYYLIARNREGTWWQAALYAVAMSTFWEYFTEAYYERPSRQDLVVTPLTGTILGELRWQAKQALRGGPAATWKTVLTVALDPVDALLGGF